MGNLDLVRPLGLAGVRCVAVAPQGQPVHFSRFVEAGLDSEAPALAERLMELGRDQAEPLILFFESDDDVKLISEERERLEPFYKFILPSQELIRNLLDKDRFRVLAEQKSLPVPPSRMLAPIEESPPADPGLNFPIVLKPVPYRDHNWYRMISSAKVLRVDSPDDLKVQWGRLAATGLRFLAQEVISGPEARVESYHVYVDADGRVAGEFTGRKVRVLPLEFGRSTALETTDAPELATVGREVVERLGWRGVAKLDFKRDHKGRPWLLEVNPRFSLWMHVGAMAGVNLPALIYADLTGRPRPVAGPARPRVRWCWPRPDAAAARELGISWSAWFRWALTSEAKVNLSLDDPMPFIRGWIGRNALTQVQTLTGPRVGK